jgi:ParB family protein of integrating conjugative element (PFGI_1 class)
MPGNNKKPPLLGIPTSIKFSDLAAQKGFVPKTDEEKRAVREQLARGSRTAQTKQAQMELVRNGLDVAAPTSQTPALRPNDEIDDAWAVLPVTAINFYEHNPRKTSNSSFLELKESIRVNGILQPLTVTKRPGEGHYILFAGGNTRLQAIKDLWEETSDAKFKEARVITKAWRGESAVLLAHMAENTQRNDMTFWDRACGTLAIKDQMDAERGVPLTHRDFESALKKAGMQVDIRTISMYRYAIERLSLVGSWLSGLAVRTLQPKLNLMVKLSTHHNVEAEEFYTTLIYPVLTSYSTQIQGEECEFSVHELLGRCEDALASKFKLKSAALKKMLTALERFPEMQTYELLKLCQTPQTDGAASHSGHSEHAEMVTQTSAAKIAPTTSSASQLPHENAHSAPITMEPLHDTHHSNGSHDDVISDDEDQVVTPEAGPIPFLDLCHQLVAQAGLGTCYEEAEGMPLGFYLGFPTDGPLDLKDNPTGRQAAWWVLAMITGQFDVNLCHSALPNGSKWRSLILEEESSGTLDALELSIQHNVGGQGEFLPIQWVLNPNPVVDLVLQVLSAAREQGLSIGVSS